MKVLPEKTKDPIQQMRKLKLKKVIALKTQVKSRIKSMRGSHLKPLNSTKQTPKSGLNSHQFLVMGTWKGKEGAALAGEEGESNDAVSTVDKSEAV